LETRMECSMRSISIRRPNSLGVSLLMSLMFFILGDAAMANHRPPVGIVTLVGEGADLALARDVRIRLLKTFNKDPRVDVQDPLKKSAKRADEQSAFQPSLDQGISDLGAGRYRSAQKNIQQALDIVSDSLTEAPKQALADIMVHLAAAQLGLGKRSLALQTLHDLLVWRVQHTLELRVPPPRGWDKLASEARGQITWAPVSSLKIRTTPENAEAFIDGRRVGPTPIEVPNLIIGTHYLTLHCEGYQRKMVPVAVEEGGKEVTFALQKDPESSAVVAALNLIQPSLGSESLPGLANLKDQFGVSFILFILVNATRSTVELKGYYYEMNEQKLVAKTVLDTGRPIKSKLLMPLALWNTEGVPSVVKHGESWYSKWWVWAIAGTVGAVGIGLGIALPLTLRSGSASEKDLIQLQW
jgi:hypothetical protein